MGGLDPESMLVQLQVVNPTGLDVVEHVAATAAEVMVRRDVGVITPRPAAFEQPQQPRLGQFAERVVHGRPRELRQLCAGLTENVIGRQVGVLGTGEHPADRPALGRGTQAMLVQDLYEIGVGFWR